MKLGCMLALLAAAGCAGPAHRPAPPPVVEPATDLVARLLIHREYRAAPCASEPRTVFYDLPRGAYIAQGWAWWGAWCRRPLRWWKC